MNSARGQEEPDFSTSYVDVDGRRLRVAVRDGDGSRPPLLLCNGLGVSLEGLQPFVDALRPQTGVIRFDVPGVGKSETPSRPYRMRVPARLTSHLLDALQVPIVDVLGVSWGGALAQQFAFRYGHRCRRLIVVSSTLGPPIPGRLGVVREMLTRRRFDDPTHARQVAPTIYGGKARTGSPTPAIFDHMDNDRRGLFYQQLAALGWTSVPFARLIRQPTLILTGDDDPIIPPVNGRLMRALLPNAELHVFHDGHLGLVTSADELAPIVEDFLDRA
ncbi:alpha/beta fold hydrolase [Mycobacterium simiae]|uniref:Alpha/beta fold hydrolase n=1 Tax=Mycobacterium simiae TaxID=1784 RepID=A0A5B1BPB8_MYCSI|nr:alpha/beta fold hydrolase [Mycobacterium simiae]KAA1249922.1 alpha/beta fold hydrolase [Mycobacterium simiae]